MEPFEINTRAWYYKRPRDMQEKLSSQYSLWRQHKKYYEQKSFWVWLYDQYKGQIDAMSQAERHGQVPNPVEDRTKGGAKPKDQQSQTDGTAYPDDTTADTHADEYGEGQDTQKSTVDKTKEGTASAEDKLDLETHEDTLIAEEANKKKILIAGIVALAVLGVGLLL